MKPAIKVTDITSGAKYLSAVIEAGGTPALPGDGGFCFCFAGKRIHLAEPKRLFVLLLVILIGRVELAIPARASDTMTGAHHFTASIERSSPGPLPVVPVPALRSDHFDAVKLLPRANPSELAGWKRIEHVVLESDVNSMEARVGDLVWGILEDDCKWGNKLIAARDSIIKGHIVAIDEARTLLHASLSSSRRCQSGASVTLHFDEIIDQDQRSWRIDGKLCRWAQIQQKSPGAPRIVEVDQFGRSTKGGATLTASEKTAFRAVRIASYAPLPTDILLGMAGKPVVMGVAGAACPAFAYNKPVDMKEKGIRQKAFVYGFVTNLPGALLVSACVRKGEQIDIRAGDEVAVELTFKP